MALAVALLAAGTKAQRRIEVLPAVGDGDTEQQVTLLAERKLSQGVEILARNLVEKSGSGRSPAAP